MRWGVGDGDDGRKWVGGRLGGWVGGGGGRGGGERGWAEDSIPSYQASLNSSGTESSGTRSCCSKSSIGALNPDE